MNALNIQLLMEELKNLPDNYLPKVLQYINILKASEKTDELKPFTKEEFYKRFDLSDKQLNEGNLIALEDAVKYFKKKNEK
jgi:hypothetical protein